MVNDRLHRLKTGAIEETRKLFAIFLYLWVLLSLFSFHKALVLKEEYVIYDQGFALVNALVLAKVILIGELLHIGENLKNKPIIYPILFKSAVFALLLICFHVIEQSLRGILLEGKSFSQSISSIAGGRLQDIVLIGIIMFVVLIPFFAFRELDRTIGAIEFRALLFGDKSESHSGLPASRRIGWRFVAVGAFALALGAGWLVWSLNRGTAAHYVTQKLERGSVIRLVNTSATVSAAETASASARLSGAIREVECNVGMKVKAGQLCARLDSRPYEILVDQEKSASAEAMAWVEKDKADLARAKAELEHNQALARRRAVSPARIEQGRSAYEQVQARTQTDEATLVQRRAALRAAEAALADTDIVAPVDGTVVSRNVAIGQRVTGNPDSQPLFLVAKDASVPQVKAELGEDDASKLEVGRKVSFTVDSVPSHAFAGEVVQIGLLPKTTRNATTYGVVIDAVDPDRSLEPGSSSAISIVVDRRDNVLRVPDRALGYSPQGREADSRAAPDRSPRVWVLRAGKPTESPVQLGLDDGTYTEIVKGDLQPGDELIIGEGGGS